MYDSDDSPFAYDSYCDFCEAHGDDYDYFDIISNSYVSKCDNCPNNN